MTVFYFESQYMNIFAEEIVKYDASTKVFGVHNIKMNPPLPLGSLIKLSRLCLDNDEQLTPNLLDCLRRETFIDSRFSSWCNEGIFVHIVAAASIMIPPDAKRRQLWLHLVPKELFDLVEQKEEYEWWQLTAEEKQLLDNKKLFWN